MNTTLLLIHLLIALGNMYMVFKNNKTIQKAKDLEAKARDHYIKAQFFYNTAQAEMLALVKTFEKRGVKQ